MIAFPYRFSNRCCNDVTAALRRIRQQIQCFSFSDLEAIRSSHRISASSAFGERRDEVMDDGDRTGEGSGGPERTRTSDLRFRKPLLYPAELRDLIESRSISVLIAAPAPRWQDRRAGRPRHPADAASLAAVAANWINRHAAMPSAQRRNAVRQHSQTFLSELDGCQQMKKGRRWCRQSVFSTFN